MGPNVCPSPSSVLVAFPALAGKPLKLAETLVVPSALAVAFTLILTLSAKAKPLIEVMISIRAIVSASTRPFSFMVNSPSNKVFVSICRYSIICFGSCQLV